MDGSVFLDAMDCYSCEICSGADFTYDEIDEGGKCLSCAHEELKQQLEREKCLRCRKLLQVKFIKDGTCLGCINEDLREKVKLTLKQSGEEAKLEEERKKYEYLCNIKKLSKMKYLRSDLDMSKINDLSSLTADDEDHPKTNNKTLIGQAVQMFVAEEIRNPEEDIIPPSPERLVSSLSFSHLRSTANARVNNASSFDEVGESNMESSVSSEDSEGEVTPVKRKFPDDSAMEWEDESVANGRSNYVTSSILSVSKKVTKDRPSPKPIMLKKYYVGDKHYHPSVSFDPKLHLIKDITEQKMVSLEKRIKSRKEEIPADLESLFGKQDMVIVVPRNDTNHYRKKIYCTDCERDIENFSKHLIKKHSIDSKKAKCAQTYYNTMYSYITLIDRHACHPPMHCGRCLIFTTSLSVHMKEIHRSIYVHDDKLFSSDLESFKEFTKEHVYSKLKVKKRATVQHTPILPSTVLSSMKNSSPPLTSKSLVGVTQHVSLSSTSALPSSTENLSADLTKGQKNTYAKESQSPNPFGPVKNAFAIPQRVGKEAMGDGDMFHNKRKLSISEYSEYGISDDTFSYVFDSVDDALASFNEWLFEANSHTKRATDDMVKALRTVWELIDVDLKMLPKSNLNADMVEKKYFAPIFKVMKENRTRKIPEECPKPSTVSNVLNAISKWLDYSIGRQIYLGIKKVEADVMYRRIGEFLKSIKPDAIQRRTYVKEYKASTLITPKETIAWGRSEYIQNVRASLIHIKDDPSEKVKNGLSCDIRNYLMIQTCFINATRCSNLLNMTLGDMKNAIESPTIKSAMEVSSVLYKTSIFYGKKVILYPNEIFEEMQTYIDYVRPDWTHQENPYIFTSLSGKNADPTDFQMKHNLPTKCLTSSFEKSKALVNSALQAVSPTRIRTSVATEMVARQGIDCNTLASSFMKHKVDTCNKYYLVNWSHRESARISMNCFNTFSMLDEADRINRELEEKPMPKPSEVIAWYKEMCQKLQKLGVSLDNDEGLIQCLSISENCEKADDDDTQANANQDCNDLMPSISCSLDDRTAAVAETPILMFQDSMELSTSVPCISSPINDNGNNVDFNISDLSSTIKTKQPVLCSQLPDEYQRYSKRKTTNMNYCEDSGSNADEDEKYGQIEPCGLFKYLVVKKKDWYKSSVKRSLLLAIVFFMDKFLSNKRCSDAPTRSEFVDHIQNLQTGKFGRKIAQEVLNFSYEKLRHIKKWMFIKYRKCCPKKLESYKTFLAEAREMMKVGLS